MATPIEYSRLVWKRSTQAGVEPTIPTATTIDNTWLETDLLIGEGFMNAEDDKFWFRTNNGLVQISLSGISSDNYFTEFATLSGNTIVFDRNDTTSAYAVDLSPIIDSADYLPLDITDSTVVNYASGVTITLSGESGSNPWEYAADYSANYTDRSIVDKAYVDANGGTISGDTVLGEISATTVSILNSGSTSREYFDYSDNLIETGVTNSAIVAGSGNTIVSGTRNIIVSGVDLSATTNDTAYFSKLNINNIGSDSPEINLGLDANGFVVTGSTGGSGEYLPLSGGSLTSGATITNDANTGSFQFNYLDSDIGLFSSTSDLTQSYLAISDSDVSLVSTGSTRLDAGSNNIVLNTSTDKIDYTAVSGHTFDAEGNSKITVFSDINITADNKLSLNAPGNITAGVNGTEFQLLDNSAGSVGIANVVSSVALLLTTQNSTIGEGSYRSAIIGGNANNIDSGTTGSLIIGGTGNDISKDLSNVAIIAGKTLSATTSDTLYTTNLNVDNDAIGIPYDTYLAVSDETTTLTSGTSKVTFYAPRGFEISKVKVSLSTSGSTTTTVDVNVGGTSILSSPIDLTSGDFVVSTTALATSTISEDDRFTVDIDAAGTDAAGLKIYLIAKTN